MTKAELIKSIQNTFDVGLKIVERKNSDYAKGDDAFANFRSAEVIGISPEQAILVRVLDKLSRVSNLLEKEAVVKDEAIEDTILDIINYMGILRAYLLSKK